MITACLFFLISRLDVKPCELGILLTIWSPGPNTATATQKALKKYFLNIEEC